MNIIQNQISAWYQKERNECCKKNAEPQTDSHGNQKFCLNASLQKHRGQTGKCGELCQDDCTKAQGACTGNGIMNV